MAGGDSGLRVIPLDRWCPRANHRGELDLLAYLEPVWGPQLAHAVGHVGLIGALRRITGQREPHDPAGER